MAVVHRRRLPLGARRSPDPAVLCAALLTAFVAACTRTAAPSESPVVAIAQGRLQGSIDAQGVRVFKGVPFAKPPVGPLRWAPPERPDGWGSGIRDATEYGAMCAQVDMKEPDYKRATGGRIDEPPVVHRLQPGAAGARGRRHDRVPDRSAWLRRSLVFELTRHSVGGKEFLNVYYFDEGRSSWRPLGELRGDWIFQPT
jgi:hypothetical protein